MKPKFHTVKINLSEVVEPEIRTKIEDLFTASQVQKEFSVEAFRSAALSKLDADIKRAEAERAHLQLLQLASKHIDRIGKEPLWLVYSQGGEIIFENPFSERDMRNYLRTQKVNLEKAMELGSEGDNTLYEGDENGD